MSRPDSSEPRPGAAAANGLSRLGRVAGKAFVAYLCLGDPSLAASVELALAYAAAGADVIELGVPFSDPLADGPVIQAAGQRALAAGFRLDDAFEAAAAVRAQSRVPLCLMVYYNNVLARGIERFVAAAAAAGVDGLIVPDLPLEEAAGIAAACRAAGLDLILFVAPTSTEERIRAVATHAGGFIYCVALTGVTGARNGLSRSLPGLLSRVRPHTLLPLYVGFGIANPETAAEAGRLADGAIVGSALVRVHHERGLGAAAALARAMAAAVHGGGGGL